MTLPATFTSKTRPNPDCILWVGATNTKGYGAYAVNGAAQLAHRIAWEDVHGPIPADLTIDHLCRVRSCVNPDHMELVTRAENVRRASRLVVGGDCRNGHPIDAPTDLYISPRGRAECRECRRSPHRKATA